MHEAYSHEVSSAGYWPGPDGEGVFYSYAYPEPDGFREPIGRAARRPATTRRSASSCCRTRSCATAADPDAVLLEFLHATYAAAADAARGTARRSSDRGCRRP